VAPLVHAPPAGEAFNVSVAVAHKAKEPEDDVVPEGMGLIVTTLVTKQPVPNE
jgi:hypothetical protein